MRKERIVCFANTRRIATEQMYGASYKTDSVLDVFGISSAVEYVLIHHMDVPTGVSGKS